MTIHARERIIEAFAELQGAGFFAMPDWQCCQTCGWAAAPDNANAVFWHEQDAEAFDEDGCIKAGDCVHLAWRGDGARIVVALERAGCVVDWDGEERTRIAVTTCHDGVTDRDEEYFAGMIDDDQLVAIDGIAPSRERGDLERDER